jgi:hypothetical protein
MISGRCIAWNKRTGRKVVDHAVYRMSQRSVNHAQFVHQIQCTPDKTLAASRICWPKLSPEIISTAKSPQNPIMATLPVVISTPDSCGASPLRARGRSIQLGLLSSSSTLDACGRWMPLVSCLEPTEKALAFSKNASPIRRQRIVRVDVIVCY